MSWKAFSASAPDLAARGTALLARFEVAFLATVRREGAPRLHPVVPVQAGDGLYVAIPPTSPKCHDLLRDPRYALHALLGENDEEFAIHGEVRQISDAGTIDAVSVAANHVIHTTDQLFEFRVGACLYGYWENVGQPNTRPIRRRWSAPPC